MYTFDQLYALAQDLWDRAGSPYMEKSVFDNFFNMKYNNFLTAELRLIEQNTEHSSRITELYKKFSKLNTDTIIRDVDLPKYRYIIRFKSKYSKNCKGVISYPEVPVRKATNNNVDVMQNDPYNKGIDADPCYVIDEAGGQIVFKVLSETVPLELSGTYVRQPQKMDSKNSGGTVFELQDFVAEAIVDAVVRKADVVVENFNRAKAETDEKAASNANENG